MVVSFAHATVEMEKATTASKVYLSGDETEDIWINQKTEDGKKDKINRNETKYLYLLFYFKFP